MRAHFVPSVALVLASLAITHPALAEDNSTPDKPRAERPYQGSYVFIDPELVDFAEPVTENAHTSNLIYLNGCFNPGDCTITGAGFGNDNSIQNLSSIVNGTVDIPPFSGGSVVWDAVVECVKETYAPFNVEITDQDPGDTPHFESITSGFPQHGGFPSGVGGVAPFSCGVINNAITFSFANMYDDDVAQICWTVAQETAHAFGLDHEYLCQDPMTYLGSCGPNKRFMDVNAQCGEFEPRQCQCGQANQNSYRRIRDHFGPGDPTPPTVTITAPADGEQVDKGFAIRVDAQDDVAVARVEFMINNNLIDSVTSAPFVTNAPQDLSDGRMNIEVRAIDNYGFDASDSIEATQGEPCDGASDCGDGETCVDGRCVPGPGTPGGLGEPCESNEACASGLCGDDGQGGKFCAEICEIGGGGCPDGFGCLESGDQGVCWAGYDDGSGGCGCTAPGARSAGGQSAMLWLLGLAIGGLVWRRRRR